MTDAHFAEHHSAARNAAEKRGSKGNSPVSEREQPMPSKIEGLIVGWRGYADYVDDGSNGTVCAQMAFEARHRADELERAYREEVVPLVNGLRWALHYAQLPEDGEYPRTGPVYQDSWGHWYCIGCGEDKSGKPGSMLKSEKEFVHAEDCKLINARAALRLFEVPAGTPAAEEGSDGNIPGD